jgi:hypothetical protein|tara:strand:+ start:520 stop:735 length:216 start_codon:yes stop_codon:yes gene_type:complete
MDTSKSNIVRPVYYNGKRYWNLEEYSETQRQIGWKTLVAFLVTLMTLSGLILMSGFYLFCWIFIPEMTSQV